MTDKQGDTMTKDACVVTGQPAEVVARFSFADSRVEHWPFTLAGLRRLQATYGGAPWLETLTLYDVDEFKPRPAGARK